MIGTFKIYSLSNFQICSTVLLTTNQHAVHYTLMTYLWFMRKKVGTAMSRYTLTGNVLVLHQMNMPL